VILGIQIIFTKNELKMLLLFPCPCHTVFGSGFVHNGLLKRFVDIASGNINCQF